MRDKSSGRPRKTATKARPRSASPLPAEDAKADQYIADQLKAMYDAVVVEPIPDRLLQLLDRLDEEPEQ
ncbi:MAG: NepR family anti-sigma factor [Roseiarcus sp.]